MVDSTLKGKRTTQNPLAKKSRLNEQAPYTFGLPVVLLLAQWEVYRGPLAFRRVKPKGSPGAQAENALWPEMLPEGVLPAWVTQVVVGAEAASPARANRHALQARQGYFVLAFPRTGKLAPGQDRREIVPHLPSPHDRQVRVPVVVPSARRRVCWPFAKRAERRQGGAVTGVWSRRRRNDRPHHPPLLVTNLPQATAHLTVALYLRRGPVELCITAVQGVVGLGQPQGTQDAARVERSGWPSPAGPPCCCCACGPSRLSRARAGVRLALSSSLLGRWALGSFNVLPAKKRARRSNCGSWQQNPICDSRHEYITHPVNFELLGSSYT